MCRYGFYTEEKNAAIVDVILYHYPCFVNVCPCEMGHLEYDIYCRKEDLTSIKNEIAPYV